MTEPLKNTKDEVLITIPLIIVLITVILKSIYILISIYSFNLLIISYSVLNIMPIIFILSFSYFLSGKRCTIYLVTANICISILFLIDILYSRAYGHLISLYMIVAKNVTYELSASIFSLLKLSDIILFLDIPILIVFLNRKSKKINGSLPLKRRIKLVIISIVISSTAMLVQFTGLENGNLLGNTRFLPLLMSPLGNHFYDLYKFIYDRNTELTNNDAAQIFNWMKNNQHDLAPSDEYMTMEGLLKEKNIIAIQVESLENFVINDSMYGQEITPNINKLLKNSLYFNYIYEQVNDGNSSDAELMFNTSIYPLNTGSAFLRFGDNRYNSMPNVLKEYGYTSMAIHGDYKEFWNRDIVYKALGFDDYISEEEFHYKGIEGMGIKDEDLFSETLL